MRCVLCKEEGETEDHLFFRCNYNKQVWQMISMGNPVISEDSRVADISDRADEKLMLNTPMWDLVWFGIVEVVWHIWRERNAHWHDKRETPTTILAMAIIRTLKLTFKEAKFKGVH